MRCFKYKLINRDIIQVYILQISDKKE